MFTQRLPLYINDITEATLNISCCSSAPQLARMHFHLTLVTAAMLCSLSGCRSQDSTAGGAAGTDGGATGSTGTRSPPTGPRGEDVCKYDTFDALLTLNYWTPATIRSKLQKKPATGNLDVYISPPPPHYFPRTEPLRSPCAAMQETCCKLDLEVSMVKDLVRPHYKQRCTNATKDRVGASCWRTGRQTRSECSMRNRTVGQRCSISALPHNSHVHPCDAYIHGAKSSERIKMQST